VYAHSSHGDESDGLRSPGSPPAVPSKEGAGAGGEKLAPLMAKTSIHDD
jgi:hypothetical protein